jgi:hypothetical protein
MPMRLSLNKKCTIVFIAAILFRLLYVVWSLSDWHVIHINTLGKVYIYQGYGICAGYGYARPAKTWYEFKELEKMASQSRITPENAPRIDASKLMPEMLHPPGMAILNAVIHKVVGTRVDLPLEILGAILDSIAAGLVCYMVAKYYHPGVGFATGLIYAFYPPLAFVSTIDRSPDGLMPIFVVGSLLCTIVSSNHHNYRSFIWDILAGVLLALGSYLRPDFLLMPVVIGFALWIYTRRFWKSFFAMTTVQVVAITLLVPWAYRNYQLCGRWIFTSSSVGATLITGLGEYHNPWNFGPMDEDRYKESDSQGFKTPWGPDADQYFRKVFWESVRSKPMAYVMTVVKRLPMGIIAPQLTGYENPYKTTTFGQSMAKGKDRFEIMMNDPFYILKAYWEVLLPAVINVLCFFCTIFLVFKDRKRIGILLVLLSPYIYSFVTHMLTHMEPRFLLPSFFSLFIGLAYVLCRAWRDDTAFQAASKPI